MASRRRARLEYLTADTLEVPRELVEAPSLQLAVATSAYKPPG